MDHLILALGVGEDIDEVNHHHVELMVEQVVELPEQFVHGDGVVEFVVTETLLASVALHERLK